MDEEPRDSEAVRKALLELAAELVQESERLSRMATEALKQAEQLRVEPIKPQDTRSSPSD